MVSSVQNSDNAKLILISLGIVTALLLSFYIYFSAFAATDSETLTVVIAESLTFSATSSSFATLTPGTFNLATTTLEITTNNDDGYYVALAGDDQGTADTVMDHANDASVGITDQTEWVPGGGLTPATTTVGNGVVRGSLDSSGDVLAFRLYSSSTACAYSSTWWGSDDLVANALWAGISSSTVARKIAICQSKGGSNSVYSASEQRLTIAYYLDTPTTQRTGSYAGDVTYTCLGN